ncbi:hypothetical protein MPSEU_000059600 [Mayamaea pseudoterrestris]|nr:hypothetical protein MPSEU_000059600 [Mayamaea pseudoterrestris]
MTSISDKNSETLRESRNNTPWHALSIDACLQELCLDASVLDTGLSTEEAKRRLQEYGYNRMSEKEHVTLLQRIWKQVANVLVGILVFVAIVSLVRALTSTTTEDKISNWLQLALILFVITANTIIGIVQEGSAEKAAGALKAMLSSEAVVLRDGQEVKVPSEELVPGDIVRLALGDRVPADLRMTAVGNLACGEAALTGESVPIDKIVDAISPGDATDPMSVPLGDRQNMCFSATLVAQGAGTGIATTTGDNTEIGTINALVNKVRNKKTNVLEQINTISTILAIAIVVTAAATFCVAFFITNQSGIDAFSSALVCAVAMIPEGLEAIVTMVFAWAVKNMAKQNAIIRALPAVETLGSVTVICSDKTGTLTKNEMTLTAFVTTGKRFKFNTDATDRTPANFEVDNAFLRTRANNAKYLKASDVIREGPSASRKSRRGKTNSFPFGIALDFGEAANGGIGSEETATMGADDDEATPDQATTSGGSSGNEHPDSNFLRQALAGGILCSRCSLGTNGRRDGEIGNPTELAILRAAYFGDVDVSEVKDSAPFIAEVPFSSEYKFMATVHEPVSANDTDDFNDGLIVHVKGAPDRMVPLCKYQAQNGKFGRGDVEPIDLKWWIEQIAVLSSHGLRVLALTRGTIPKDTVQPGQQLGPDFVQERGGPWLTLVGLCAIIDPPRPECITAIAEAHSAGVRVAMITGDHKDTALAIGSMLGLVDKQHSEAITGPEIDAMADDELTLAVQRYNVFARASPQNKIRIVKALQKNGEICGMTGDGVNDAPALKAADMGVAMGKEGTDVAREASDMILADDNFATIVAAIREGRVVWENLRKSLIINTCINNSQGMTVLFGLLCGLDESPLTPIQVLYCNLITACTLGFACAIEPAEGGLMNQPPRRVGKRLVGRFLFLRIVIGTTALVAVTVGATFWVSGLGYAEPQQRAQALNTLSFGAIAITASARFSRKSAFHRRSLHGNHLAFWSYGIITVLQVFITYVPGLDRVVFSMGPMDGAQWGIVVLMMFAVFVVMEVEKCFRNYLSFLKYDVDDLEADPFWDSRHEIDQSPLPDEVSRFGRNELAK